MVWLRLVQWRTADVGSIFYGCPSAELFLCLLGCGVGDCRGHRRFWKRSVMWACVRVLERFFANATGALFCVGRIADGAAKQNHNRLMQRILLCPDII